MTTLRWALVLALGALAMVACGGGSGDTSCTTDTDCSTGKVCVRSACTVKACDGAAGCEAAQTCVDTDHDGAKECTAVDCTTDDDCASKPDTTCVQGACIPKETTTPTDDTVGGDDTTPAVDTTAKDEQTTPGTGTLCQPCSKDADCGDGRYTLLAEGSFCTAACESNNDCPSGYMCFQVTTEGKDCVPGLYTKCPQCLIDGCPAGQTCDQTAGTCKAAAGECGTCDKDDDCGLGARCFKFSAEEQRCVPECGTGCPTGSTCGAMTAAEGTEGVQVCKPTSGTCCFGDDCGAACNCSGATPYCNPANQCVECLSDANCPQAKPSCVGNVCKEAGSNCSAATPIPCDIGNGCCQCTNDTHCSGGTPYCQANGTCGSEQACACVAPYPACLNSGGQVVCVECIQDADCTSGCTCNLTDHTCMGADGAACGGSGTIPSAECTGCTSDGDCPAAEGFTLKCDVPSGCCYDTTGKCDNTNSFCPPGASCTGLMAIAGIDLGSLFGGGTGIPGMPGGGGLPTDMLGDMSSYCSCPPACLGGQACVTGIEISDKAAGMLGSLLGGMINPSSGSFCADLNSVPDLLGGLLGGGGLPLP